MAKTGHPNFVYKISSPWRVGRHTWSIVGNHSGASLNAVDAQDFLLGASSPWVKSYAPALSAAGAVSSPPAGADYPIMAVQLVEAAYYDGVNSAPVYAVSFNVASPPPASTIAAIGSAYVGGTVNSKGQPGVLEQCIEFQNKIGLSVKNKPVFAKKFLHCVPAAAFSVNDATGAVQVTDGGGTLAVAMKAQSDGSWKNGLVYITKSGKQPAPALWTAQPGNHQVYRRRRKKIVPLV